jgi:branched-chain amino acid aminotransferase
MASGLSCIDGVLLAAEDALVPVSDPGLFRGDGAFEAIRIYDGRTFGLEQHLERLQRSAEGLRLPVDIDGFRADVALMLDARSEGDDVLRLLATRGGRRITLFESLPEFSDSVALGTVTYAPVRVLDGVKSLSYAGNMLASRLAQERGFDDALLVTPHNRVLECPTSSFFAVTGGVLRTPPLSDHILDSITRRVVLAVADVREEPIALADLDTIDEAFIASSVRELVPVSRVEDRSLQSPGPVTRKVLADVRERIAGGLDD